MVTVFLTRVDDQSIKMTGDGFTHINTLTKKWTAVPIFHGGFTIIEL